MGSHFNFGTLRVASSRVVSGLVRVGSGRTVTSLGRLFRATSLMGFTGRSPRVGRGSTGLVGTVSFVGRAGRPSRRGRGPRPARVAVVRGHSLHTGVLLVYNVILLSMTLMNAFMCVKVRLCGLFTWEDVSRS